MTRALRYLERFSFECGKVSFASSTLHDCLKNLAPLFHPIISKTNRDTFAYVFSRFASATCNYFEF